MPSPLNGAAAGVAKIGVVIPCYKVRQHILEVIERTLPFCDAVYVVDDKCPEETGAYVTEHCRDPRVRVLLHPRNAGVGAAVLTGCKAALADGCDIIVKVDGDGQMPAEQIPALVKPIIAGYADYVKGNRFFFLSNAHGMPRPRRLGNLVLSFMTKLSTGYWHVMDPTNGFFAIEARVAQLLPHDQISRRFFFESDMLFHLGLLRARVVDFPMRAVYGSEVSNLRIPRVVGPFLAKHLRNTLLRILYKYFVRDFSVASLELLAGIALFTFGFVFGATEWIKNASSNVSTETGTIMLAVVPLLMGFQLLLAFINYDITTTPREPLHPLLEPVANTGSGGGAGSGPDAGDKRPPPA
jgi:glycosyltransferase involved in cell wall biosynthesis